MNDRTSEPTTSTPDKNPIAYELAERIAKHMAGPARWTANRRITPDGDDMPENADLVRDTDGARISVCVGGYRQEGRVTFRPNWPKYKDGSGYQPRAYTSITCSAGRDGKGLAREIERRLLVDYDPAYRAALEEVRASDAAAGEAWATAERIARAIGAELPSASQGQRNGGAVQLHGGPDNVFRLKVDCGYGEGSATASFEVHNVDEETTLRVLALLTGNGEVGQ